MAHLSATERGTQEALIATLSIAALIDQAKNLENAGQADLACQLYADWILLRIRLRSSHEFSLAIAWFNLGVLRSKLGRLPEAILAYRQALRAKPDLYAARINYGLIVERSGNAPGALEIWRQGLPDKVGVIGLLNHIGRVNERLKNYPEAERVLRESLAYNPDQSDVIQHWAHLRSKQCKWPALEPISDMGGGYVRDGEQLLQDVGPFASIALTDDPLLQLANTKRWLEARGWGTKPLPVSRTALVDSIYRAAERGVSRKLRIGYASADFHHHATAMLIVQVLEHVDRSRFEQVAFSWGPEDGSPMRCRIKACFDEWNEVGQLGDPELSEEIRRAGIDVLVDLKGLTQDARPGVFAQRAAPVQVNYLGYPGSLPLINMDYCLVDNVIAPPALRAFYTEAVCCLPDSYQPNDRLRQAAPVVPSREQLGLPDGAFVFCSFNNNYKITSEVFDVWMGLLRAREGSVLWLIRSNDEAERRLRMRAEASGVSASRIIFAPVVHISEHLARHVHADLFLDTFPCGAHTTASDALWAGLPVLTRVGRSFASRVAASLLSAVGLKELITETIEDYQRTALALSLDLEKLSRLRRHLHETRLECPLFDSKRYARHLEDAYVLMWLQSQSGCEPCDIEVPLRGRDPVLLNM